MENNIRIIRTENGAYEYWTIQYRVARFWKELDVFESLKEAKAFIENDYKRIGQEVVFETRVDWAQRGMIDDELLYKRVMDYKLIENIEIDGIDTKDYPDFCDAFIASADYDGKEMTEEQLDELNEDSEFVYECVQNHLF